MRRGHILLLLSLSLASVFCLALIWEFLAENWVLDRLGVFHHVELAVERWEYVISATAFTAIGLIVPAWLVMRMEARLTQLNAALEQRVTERTRLLQRELEERERAEAALQDSERRFKDYTETAADWFWEMDETLRFSYTSERFEAITGCPAGEIIGHRHEEVISEHGELPENWSHHLLDIEEHRRFDDLELVWHEKDGERHILTLSGKPIEDAWGRFRGYRGTGRDVTLRKQAELSLLEAKRAAESANRFKSQFLANVSHEMRTPLNGMLGMTELLLHTPLSPQQQRLTDNARRSGELLMGIINDVLDLSKVESGRLTLHTLDFDLCQTVHDTLDLFGEGARRKGLDLEVEVLEGVPRYAHGDSGRLRQVLVNLVGNAIKFTQRGSVSVICKVAQRDDPYCLVHFLVRDTGIGIAPEIQGRIFQSFVQADGSIGRRYGGTGLGLAIAKSLVELMGGAMGVESAPGQGASFWFTVRLEVREAPPADSGAADGLAGPEAGAQDTLPGEPRILLAEDNVINAEAALAMLETLGCRVDKVETGRQALDAYARDTYDLILMDCQMPDIDGMEATTEIRRIEGEHPGGRRIPIVAVTAHAMAGDRQRCLATGMDDYMTKPISIASLGAMLRRWLRD